MSSTGSNSNGEVPTVLVRDSNGSALLCFLEQLIPINQIEYALLTPVDTPVSLFLLKEDEDPELIETKKTKIKPMKVAFKYGTSSQSEEDLIGGHVDDWNNAIIKGDLDPSTTFMQYIDMLLGRYSRGGIISVVPKFS